MMEGDVSRLVGKKKYVTEHCQVVHNFIIFQGNKQVQPTRAVALSAIGHLQYYDSGAGLHIVCKEPVEDLSCHCADVILNRLHPKRCFLHLY